MEPNLNVNVRIVVTQAHIDEGACRDPNKCMIKLAIAEALGVAHGYIRVDATGVRITRRKDYRERADLPRKALHALLAFDRNERVEPFDFMLRFRKTTRVVKSTPERRTQINAARATRKAEGRPDKTYDLAKRIAGVASTSPAVAVDLPDATVPSALRNKVEALQIRLRHPMKEILAKIPGNLTERAKAIGVSRQTMYVWADEKYRPTGNQAERIAELTGVPAAIIRGEGGAAEL
jgi:DNA-binding XRE family transcriptional regulator